MPFGEGQRIVAVETAKEWNGKPLRLRRHLHGWLPMIYGRHTAVGSGMLGAPGVVGLKEAHFLCPGFAQRCVDRIRRMAFARCHKSRGYEFDA